MSKFKQEGSPLFAYRLRAAANEIAACASDFPRHQRQILTLSCQFLHDRAQQISPLPIQRPVVDAPSRGWGVSQCGC